jgi:hypothetical protein
MEGKMVYQVWGTFDKYNSMWLAAETASLAKADEFAKALACSYRSAKLMVFEGPHAFNRVPLAEWSHADH